MIARATKCKICRTCLITIIEGGGTNIIRVFALRYFKEGWRREVEVRLSMDPVYRNGYFSLGSLLVGKSKYKSTRDNIDMKLFIRISEIFEDFFRFAVLFHVEGGTYQIWKLFKCMNMRETRDMSDIVCAIFRIYKNSFAMTLTIFPRFYNLISCFHGRLSFSSFVLVLTFGKDAG